MEAQINKQIEELIAVCARYIIVFGIGWAASASYYKVEHLWVQKDALTVQAHCEHKRAQVAVASAESSQPLPQYATQDCPHPK